MTFTGFSVINLDLAEDLENSDSIKSIQKLAKKYKEAKGADKDKIVADLKEKTKLKKELEAILDK